MGKGLTRVAAVLAVLLVPSESAAQDCPPTVTGPSYLFTGADGPAVPLYVRTRRAASPLSRYLAPRDPGVDFSARFPNLQGGFPPSSGWPAVLRDHFAPGSDRLGRLWLVQTRGCPTEPGTDPWACVRVLRFDPCGRLVDADFRDLLAQAAGRPTVVQVQGHLATPDTALFGLLWTHTHLGRRGALPPDAVLVAFDWPSSQVYFNAYRDISRRGEVAYAAGYHLARLVHALPPDSRVCLIGHSYGARVLTAALHLLGGGDVAAEHGPPARLPTLRPDLRLRAVAVEAGVDHHWLNPGERFGLALAACEGWLNLYNRCDRTIVIYPLLWPTDHHRALGRVGLLAADRAALGPLLARYAERNLFRLIGREHSLLRTVAHPEAARWIAPYTWALDYPPTAAAGNPSAAGPAEPPGDGPCEGESGTLSPRITSGQDRHARGTEWP